MKIVGLPYRARLRLLSKTSRDAPAQCLRTVSTISAIKKGLRASANVRDSPWINTQQRGSPTREGLRASSNVRDAPRINPSEQVAPMREGVYQGRKYTAPFTFEEVEQKIRLCARLVARYKAAKTTPVKKGAPVPDIEAIEEKVRISLQEINALAVPNEDMNRRFTNLFFRKLHAKGLFYPRDSRTPEPSATGIIVKEHDGSFSWSIMTRGGKGLPGKTPEQGGGQRPTQRGSIGSNSRLRSSEHGTDQELSNRDSSRPRSAFKGDRVTTQRISVRKDDDGDPHIPIKYTTAASQFLYGANNVLAILRSGRRKLYRLHMRAQEPGSPEIGAKAASAPKTKQEITVLAEQLGIPIERHSNSQALDKMSRDSRAHNGIVLEASALPIPPVISLGKPDSRTAAIPVSLEEQSQEDKNVNGTAEHIPFSQSTWRQPLVVFLDGIVDPGNVGNIIRTCHFYGVDAIAIAVNTCANLFSAVLAKASSGACEAIQLLAVGKPSNFIYQSGREGWKIYAAVAPDSEDEDSSEQQERPLVTTATVGAASPLATSPCILILGAEGEGLRQNLKNRANFHVTIEAGEKPSNALSAGVDSLNVGTAAGVLLDAFLRRPAGVQASTTPTEGKAASPA